MLQDPDPDAVSGDAVPKSCAGGCKHGAHASPRPVGSTCSFW
jgi:hypothetical protein